MYLTTRHTFSPSLEKVPKSKPPCRSQNDLPQKSTDLGFFHSEQDVSCGYRNTMSGLESGFPLFIIVTYLSFKY